ncbi:ferritin-like domain-containing protein [Nonlabens antarcticus]|uniref:ferritin-like domain-containing protein n=1 Tax=Nonlabens antarcticus TaxID=392714 RepID=UPI0018912767|nr:PA2169 family four-helix-bundle protein [Nonlabens antarcticus]
METTREGGQKKVHENTVKQLNQLLEKSYDAEKGYKNAIDKIESPRLKTFFQERALERSRFATELHNELSKINEEPTTKGSTAGTIHRTWMDIKTAWTSDNDESILEECIRGEKASVEEYKEALKEDSLLAEVRPTVRGQLSHIESTLETVKKLEDLN